MLIHPKNVGRTVKLKNGRVEKIIQVLASKESFRIASEVMGPVVHDYEFSDIAEGSGLIVSYDQGETWLNLASFKST